MSYLFICIVISVIVLLPLAANSIIVLIMCSVIFVTDPG